MWLYGDLIATADPPAQSGVSDQLIIMIGGVVTAAIVALGGVLVAMVNRGSSRTTASPPAPVPTPSDHVLYERTAVLTRRADDGDDRFDVMDRSLHNQDDRIEAIERHLDHREPDWRR